MNNKRHLKKKEKESLYLVKIVKELKNSEDAGSYEETHLTADIT